MADAARPEDLPALDARPLTARAVVNDALSWRAWRQRYRTLTRLRGGPGDVPVVAFLSLSMGEAAARLRTIGEILITIGEPFERRGDELELTGTRRVLFKVFACNTHAVGFTAILIIGDEVARWENRDHSANPAAQVVGSLMPSLATQPYGIVWT